MIRRVVWLLLVCILATRWQGSAAGSELWAADGEPPEVQEITELIGDWSRQRRGTVVFVTHDVNPVLSYASRVVFVVDGRWAAGRTDDVLTTETMSGLYQAPVEVLRVKGRIVVVGEASGAGLDLDEPHHFPAPTGGHGAHVDRGGHA